MEAAANTRRHRLVVSVDSFDIKTEEQADVKVVFFFSQFIII